VDSLKIFDDKPLAPPDPPRPRRRKPKRPLWQVLLASGLIPGAGHLLLGKVREGMAIFLVAGSCQILVAVALSLGLPSLSWIAFRAGGAAYFHGVADAALLLFEMADGRSRRYPEAPRRVAFWNFVGYGMGYEILGEQKLALGLGAAALAFHLVLPLFWTPAVVAGEILLAGMALHAGFLARAQGIHSGSPPSDSTPRWLRRTLVVSAGLTLLLILANQWVALAWRDALRPNRDEAVVVSPFYDNPHYGLHLEMPSPGWDFLTPGDDELFSAAHLTENAVLSLKVAPRTPLHWDDKSWLNEMLRRAQDEGWRLRIASSHPATLGDLPGWAITARGTYQGKPRTIEIVTAARGLQHITLWYEWVPTQDTFAATEMDQILASLQLH